MNQVQDEDVDCAKASIECQWSAGVRWLFQLAARGWVQLSKADPGELYEVSRARLE